MKYFELLTQRALCLKFVKQMKLAAERLDKESVDL